jgi:hypothetical protein
MTERAGRPGEDDVIEVAELPSLPDGGLSANMPAWLRHAPSFTKPVGESETTIDLGVLTAGLQLPDWLGELSARVDRGDEEAVVAWTAQASEVDIVVTPAVSTETPKSAPVAIEAEPANQSRYTEPSTQVRPVMREAELPETLEPHVEPPYRLIGFMLILFALGVIVFTIWSATN